MRLTDGTTAQLLTVNSVSEDSGPLAINYAARTGLSVLVRRAATCGTPPESANVVVQYRAR